MQRSRTRLSLQGGDGERLGSGCSRRPVSSPDLWDTNGTAGGRPSSNAPRQERQGGGAGERLSAVGAYPPDGAPARRRCDDLGSPGRDGALQPREAGLRRAEERGGRGSRLHHCRRGRGDAVRHRGDVQRGCVRAPRRARGGQPRADRDQVPTPDPHHRRGHARRPAGQPDSAAPPPGGSVPAPLPEPTGRHRPADGTDGRRGRVRAGPGGRGG